MLKNDLEKMKLYLTTQIQEITSTLKYEEKLPVNRQIDEKIKNQLNSDLLQLKKERAEIIRKIKRFRVDSLHLQARKTLEELNAPNNIVDRLISKGTKKPISLFELPVIRKRRKKN